MPDPLFAELYRDTEYLTWAPTEQVRRRGRQRTRRTRIAAGLASAVAVAVVATGAAALAGRPDASPPAPPATNPPAPSSTPSRAADPTPSRGPTSADATPPGPPRTSSRPSTETPDPAVPAAALLQLSDLPDGFVRRESDLDGDWSLEAVTIYCRNNSPSIRVGEVALRGVVFDSPTAGLIERVTRHSGDNAAMSMDRVRRVARECVPHREGDSLSIMAEGLAGDESVLVGAVIEGKPGRWLFVRQGDLVAQLRLDSKSTPAEARIYAQRAANRLCAGTDAC
ncbi:hypothetical protein SAMN05444365_106163 [Micromonospora pattaloongensis]|uniref:Uncharacterized protein n=1 Tax=Micromonospora pattaloongensis TaxID=405436 RepID=A0A1H3QXC2_9ACTN|nr:hypothetical protein [Micromonospora pattaloongensis]SDZ17608.1 hypothetical protein SAMN05444365_106163 [Micromonospora pattaloongensis]